jgi:hypothetical protein
MNRTKIRNYAPQARRDFLQAVTDRAALLGLTAATIEPVSLRDIPTIPGELFAKFQTSFYADPTDAVFKAMGGSMTAGGYRTRVLSSFRGGVTFSGEDSMNVGELRGALSSLDAQQDVMIAVDGTFAPVVGVTAASGASFIVVRGQGKMQESKRFTIGEEGVIGHLARLGVSDDEIGEVLGRPSESVKRKRQSLGF